ncbi:MAG: Trk system potassium transporter TrkA, partial [Pseudomonadota bacterium]
MRIIICGAGRVGQGIARRLSGERHDVTMIDQDARLIDKVATMFEVRGVVGHSGHPTVLKNAGADNAEMIIAVTHTDEVNMITCQIAHSLFDVPTKIARVRSQAYLKAQWTHLFSRDNLPIDLVISPEVEVGESILQRLETPGAFLTSNFAQGSIKLLGVGVGDKSPIQDTTFEQIGELFPDLNAHLVGIGRGDRFFAPRAGDQLLVGDRLYWASPTDSVGRMLDILGVQEQAGRRVVIVGGGNIGLYVARALEKRRDLRVRLVEANAKRAEHAAETLKRAIVMQGDGLSPDMLEEAGVGEADLVIGVTNDDKTNLLLGALAKNLGARKVLALVNETDLADLRGTVGVDVVIDPRAVTVSRILLRLRR